MKRFLLLLCCFAALLRGGEMGRFDKISGNFTVTTDFWTCTFLEGSLFPGEFTFRDGTAPGCILFDAAATGADGKTYRLAEERWAETKILRNDENALVIERRGCFWRNISPLITRLDGVEALCRYEFDRRSPAVLMKYTFRKKPDAVCTVNRCFALSWYFRQPFDTVVCKERKEPFVLRPDDRFRNWDAPDRIVLEGKTCRVSLRAPRVIAALRKKDALFPCSLDGGLWQFRWEKGETLIEREAVLTVEPLR